RAVREACGDRGHAREARRDAALTPVCEKDQRRARGATPRDHRAVALQREAVVDIGGDRSDAGETGRHAALPGVMEVAERVGTAAPGDDGAVALHGEAVGVAGGDAGHPVQARPWAAL